MILCLVDLQAVGILSQLFHSLFHYRVTLDGIARHHYIFLELTLIRSIFSLHSVFQLYNSLGMCQTCGRSHKYRGIIFFAEVIGCLNKILSLLRI